MRFMNRKKFNKDAWYLDIIVGVGVGVLVLMTKYWSGYEDYLNRTGSDLPSGKAGKIGLLVLKQLDSYGGKPLVIGVLIGFSMLCFWWGYRSYIKRNK